VKLGLCNRKEAAADMKNVELRNYITEDQLIRKQNDFICTICTDVVITPVKCAECEHYYCAKCIKDSLKRNKNCPDCREIFTPADSFARFERNALNELEFKCFRCPDLFRYEQAEKHAKELCKFFALNCPTLCGVNGLKEELDLKKHLTEECVKMKDKNLMILDFSSLIKPDFFEGLEEKVLLMSAAAQEGL
jgi:hypothetical protein